MKKTLFAVRFYNAVADVVAHHIREANGGSWPLHINHWQQVARKFGYVLILVLNDTEVRSCYVRHERALVIEYQSDISTLFKHIAHEMAHGILYDGSSDGEMLFDWPCDDCDCHIVARLVERYCDTATIH